MVHGIVRQSGGDIVVDSEPGRGTRFRIYLPRHDAHASLQPSARELSIRPGSETVLVVEDEQAVRRLAERILRGAGYTVLAAASAGDALIAHERHGGPVDLLLTDVVMPQMSGRELAARLTRVQPTLRVLYMSGYPDKVLAERGVLESGTALMRKPFEPADLTRKVREVLDAR